MGGDRRLTGVHDRTIRQGNVHAPVSMILLGLSVSLEALWAGVAYGITGIRAPGHALWLLGVVTVRGGPGRWAGATPHASWRTL